MKTTFTKLKRTHKVLLISQIIVAAVLTVLIAMGLQKPTFTASDRNMQIVVLLVFGALYITGKMLQQKQIGLAKSKTTPTDKLEHYGKGCLINWQCLHAANLFASICFFLVGNFSFIVLAVFVSAYFFLLSPSKLKMAIQTQTHMDELKNME